MTTNDTIGKQVLARLARRPDLGRREMAHGATGNRARDLRNVERIRDVVGDMQRVFGNITTETFNAGSLFVAWARKREAGA